MSEIVLASGSVSRRAMLEGAGLVFTAVVPNVDEEMMRGFLLANGAVAQDIALALAEAKALAVSERHQDALVIGSDQVLVCGGRLFEKALDVEGAHATLSALRGRAHRLISAAVVAKNDTVLWRQCGTADMTMREFSDEFLREYLTAEVPQVLGSVGCYRIEGRGVQLFDEIAGDHFTIRGLPLVPVLAALRARCGIPT
jgi:nucleoside triphosphate pyrophosphatase